MSIGQFKTLPLASVIINREERQRRVLTNIDELAESIQRVGLINPIVVTADNILVAGERRFTACTQLGWDSITVHYVEDLSPYELQAIELEENLKRVDLSWQDECLALASFHALKLSNEPDWTQRDTAEALGYVDTTVSNKLMVATALIEGNEKVQSLPVFSTALNLLKRNSERKAASTLSEVGSTMFKKPVEGVPEPTKVTGKDPSVTATSNAPPATPLLHADFSEWQSNYADTKFNFIHCDFPYGINVAKSPRQSSALQEFYDDSPDVYWNLLDTLALSMDNVVAESAHLIFWFSMDFYQQTLEILTAMGWKVNIFPLVWHKDDGAGIAPDPQRGPRRTYETAFFATRGDRKLTEAGAVTNSRSFAGRKGPDVIHISEKPQPMLRHFFRMVCDEYTVMLDPTCGSGNACKVATALGATKVLGLEKLEEFYQSSVLHYWDTVHE